MLNLGTFNGFRAFGVVPGWKATLSFFRFYLTAFRFVC